MSELTTRVRFSSTIEKSLAYSLKELSAKTDIPQSKLIDRAIQDLLNKYRVGEQG